MNVALERKLLYALLLLDYTQLVKHRDANPTIVRRRQQKRLQNLMKRAYEIPFYRERFEAVGMRPEDFTREEDLLKFPLLYKDEFKAWMREEIGKPQYEGFFIDNTSGSSGTPTRVLYSPREKAWNMANWMRVLAMSGKDPFRSVTASRRNVHAMDVSQQNIIQRMGILRRVAINQFADEPSVIQQINNARPDFLYMNKSELMRLAIYAETHGLSVWQPSFFIPTGEKIDAGSTEILCKTFGKGLIDSFGTTEVGACLTKYPGSEEYFINRDVFSVLVVDEHGDAANFGNLVITPLYKTDVPLINYVVGDLAATHHNAVGDLVIDSIEGRDCDFVRHADGSITTFGMLSQVFSSMDALAQYRIIQNSLDSLDIQLVEAPGNTLSPEEIERHLDEALARVFVSPITVRYEWLPVIQPDQNGKLRLIVSHLS